MPSFPGWLKRSSPHVSDQASRYPEPPSWLHTHVLPSVKRKPPPKPGLAQCNVPLVPWDTLRAHGDTEHTPEISTNALLAYSVMGGLFGDFNNPITLRPYAVQVDNTHALKVKSGGNRFVEPYEGTVTNGAPATITLIRAPVNAVLINNAGTAALTVTITSVYESDGQTPDFSGLNACTWPVGFIETLQVEAVGVLISTADAGNQQYYVQGIS
jgi:hypothetical protein